MSGKRLATKRVRFITESYFREMIGETVHTAFRKGDDGPGVFKIHQAISDLPPESWRAVLGWMTWAMFYHIPRRKAQIEIEEKP